MTHKELIAKMDDLDIALSNGFGKAETIIGSIKAVRAVIELHKPNNYLIEGFEITQSWCTGDSESLTPYPCATIQAITEALQ